jgi:hypothetical protein
MFPGISRKLQRIPRRAVAERVKSMHRDDTDQPDGEKNEAQELGPTQSLTEHAL